MSNTATTQSHLEKLFSQARQAEPSIEDNDFTQAVSTKLLAPKSSARLHNSLIGIATLLGLGILYLFFPITEVIAFYSIALDQILSGSMLINSLVAATISGVVAIYSLVIIDSLTKP